MGTGDTSILDIRVIHPMFLREPALSHPGYVLVPQVLLLMGMCHSALLSRSSDVSDPTTIARAKDYIEIVIALFPLSPAFLALAGQIAFFVDERSGARAIPLCEKAISLDPTYRTARHSLDLVQDYLARQRAEARAPRLAAQGMAGGNARRSGAYPDIVSLPLSIAWTFGGPTEIVGEIVAGGGFAILGDRHGTLYCVDVHDGNLKWKFNIEGINGGAVAISDGLVFAGHANRAFCLDLESGAKIWAHENSVVARSALASMNCVLTVGAIVVFCDDWLTILRKHSGAVLHSKVSPFDPWSHTGACADDGFVYFPAGSRINRLSIETGQWARPLDSVGKVTAGPVVYKDRIVYGNNRGQIVATDLTSGEVAWSFETDFDKDSSMDWFVTCRPAVKDDVLAFGSRGGTCYAVDSISGCSLWKTSINGEICSPLIILGETIFALTASGCLNALALNSGAILWQKKFGRFSGVESGMAFEDSTLLVGIDKLYALATSPHPKERIFGDPYSE